MDKTVSPCASAQSDSKEASAWDRTDPWPASDTGELMTSRRRIVIPFRRRRHRLGSRRHCQPAAPRLVSPMNEKPSARSRTPSVLPGMSGQCSHVTDGRQRERPMSTYPPSRRQPLPTDTMSQCACCIRAADPLFHGACAAIALSLIVGVALRGTPRAPSPPCGYAGQPFPPLLSATCAVPLPVVPSSHPLHASLEGTAVGRATRPARPARRAPLLRHPATLAPAAPRYPLRRVDPRNDPRPSTRGRSALRERPRSMPY
jgi:hypothetical protein